MFRFYLLTAALLRNMSLSQNQLPDEVLLEIFQQVASKATIVNIARTCKKWNCLALDIVWYDAKLKHLWASCMAVSNIP